MFFTTAGMKVNGKNRKGTNALHMAAQHGGWCSFIRSFSCQGHQVTCNKGHCLDAGHLDLVKLLLKRRANPAATNRKGQTAGNLATDPAIKAALDNANSIRHGGR